MFKKIILSIIFVLCITASIFSSTYKVSADSDVTIVVDYNKSRLEEHLPSHLTNELKSYTTSIEFGDTISPRVPTSIRNYYKCTWTINGEVIENISSYPMYNNITLKANWEPIKQKIYYNYLDGEEDEITNLQTSKEFTVEDGDIYYYIPTRPGYMFVDWYKSPNFTKDSMDLIKEKLEIGSPMLYARWEAIEYNINYNTDASNIDNPPTYNISTGGFELADPSKEGYIFEGWYLDKDFNTKCLKIDNSFTGDLDLYPKWTPKTYSITYILPDGSYEVVDADYGSTAELPTTLNKNIFQIVVTDVSRKNVTGDTTISIKLINIWYVYLLGFLILSGVVVAIVFAVIKRKKKLKKLRYIYQSNSKQNRRWR